MPGQQELKRYTGSSISILYILIGEYDENNICRGENVVDIHSIYREILSKTLKLKILKFLLSKKLNLKLGSILAQNSTFDFEGI